MHWNVIDYNKFLNIVFMHLNKQNFIITLIPQHYYKIFFLST